MLENVQKYNICIHVQLSENFIAQCLLGAVPHVIKWSLQLQGVQDGSQVVLLFPFPYVVLCSLQFSTTLH